MHVFEVWAPAATRVDLVLPGLTGKRPGHQPALAGADSDQEHGPDRLPMRRAPGGRWSLPVTAAGPGTDYAFSLDGGPPRPDPGSAWQPAGVHGPSRVFDAGAHAWQDGSWPGRDILGAVFYELHVGTYTAEGTLDAAIDRLDHLVELGVEVVELMPVAAFDGRWGWGYDGVAPYAVHQPYGGPAGLQRFVDACHQHRLAVCLDVVYNHLGPSGNYLSEFGPYFTRGHRTPWGDAVNLDDEGRTQVRRWVCDNAARWLRDFHLDCLRLDAVHSLQDSSGRHLLQQLSDEVADLERELGRPLSLVAESDLNDPRMIEPVRQGGMGMTAQWSDDFHHALHVVLTGERQGYYADFADDTDTPQVLARTLTRVFRHAGELSTFRGTVWGRPVDPRRHRGHRFLGYLQTHDQIGNRAGGDRIGAGLPPGLLAAGAALVLTSPFTPLLFMGEEWAAGTPWQFFTDFADPDLAEAVRRGRRAEFEAHGWPAGAPAAPAQRGGIPDPQDPATRQASVLDWAEPGKEPHARMLRWYRDLIALRRREQDLRDDDLRRVAVDTGPGWLVLHRGRVHVLVNLGEDPVELRLSEPVRPLLSWDPAEPVPGGLRLPGETVVVAGGRIEHDAQHAQPSPMSHTNGR